ncbi:MAG: cation:proton antiporter [Aerococcus sp.]|nr:cation:proton antiporter [Aerococcus sp.]
MLTSLGIVLLIGMIFGWLAERLHLPRIIGLLTAGILIGPYALNWLQPSLLDISSDLRQMALVIILIKAGLSLDLNDLKRVGRPAVMMSLVPASFEILGYVILTPLLLGLDHVNAAVMGAVLAAVSPAVVVPRMVYLMEHGYGTKQSIPQMIMAGASCDDIFVIVLFTTFSHMAEGGSIQWQDFLNIPLSIVLGVGVGALVGYMLVLLQRWLQQYRVALNQSLEVVLLLAVSFLLMALETALKGHVPLSGLLAVVAMAAMIRAKRQPAEVQTLSASYGKLWVAAEILLFVLVGAAVNIHYTLQAGPAALALILLALCFRSVGVWLCMQGTHLTQSERLFCVFAYLPKATVQAAIGSVPLAMGLASGQLILSVAVLGILVTAPLGALLIDQSYPHLLKQNQEKGADTAEE